MAKGGGLLRRAAADSIVSLRKAMAQNKRPSGYDEPVKYGTERFWNESLSPFENKVIEMARNNFSNDHIAEELETTVGSIKATATYLRKMGFDIPYGHPGRMPKMTERARLLIRAGKGNQDIADILGVSENSAAQFRRKYNLTLPVGERYHSLGYRYALPIAGAGGGLLGRLAFDDGEA